MTDGIRARIRRLTRKLAKVRRYKDNAIAAWIEERRRRQTETVRLEACIEQLLARLAALRSPDAVEAEVAPWPDEQPTRFQIDACASQHSWHRPCVHVINEIARLERENQTLKARLDATAKSILEPCLN